MQVFLWIWHSNLYDQTVVKLVAFSVTAILIVFALDQNGFDSAFCLSYCVALFFAF